MCFWNFEMIEHRERIGVEMLVGVDLGRRRRIRGRIAPRGIGNAAVSTRKVTHLRLPIGVVGREFVQEDDRCSPACFLEIEPDIVTREGVGHLMFLLMGRPRKSQLMVAAAMRRDGLFFVRKCQEADAASPLPLLCGEKASPLARPKSQNETTGPARLCPRIAYR